MSTYQTQGFILSTQDYREADKIFYIYTSTYGKIEALACGVRQIKSKLRAHLEPFSVVDIMIASGRYHDRLIGAVSQRSYNKIKSNYELSIINYQLIEIVDQLTKLHHPDERIFNLLEEVFDFIESREADQFVSKLVHSYFIINFLGFLGYTPELRVCIRCKKPVFNRLFFSFKDGSVVCERCVAGDREVSPDSIDFLKRYLIEKLQDSYNAGNSESYKLVQDFLAYHLDKPLKSKKLISYKYHDR